MSELDLEEMRKFVKRGVAMVGESFEDPEDDWAPIVFVAKDGAIKGLQVMHDDELSTGQALAQAVLSVKEADVIVVVSSVWMASMSADTQREDIPRPSQMHESDPRRAEAVTVAGMDTSGEKFFQSAKILRDGENPPTLDEWVDYEEMERTEGRLFAAMEQVLA